jgi:hypothetical protein
MWQRQDSTTDQLQSVAEALGEKKGAVLLAWVENKGPRPEWLEEALAVSKQLGCLDALRLLAFKAQRK